MAEEKHEWPRDEDGNPMAKVSFSVSELIPHVQYGNVTCGPATIEKFVKASDDGSSERDEINRIADTLEKEVLAFQRGTILEVVRKAQLGS